MTAHIQALPKWGGEPGRWAGAADTQDTPAFRYLLRFAILASTRHFQSPNLPSGHVPCTHYHILAFLTPSQVPCKPHPSTAVASRVRPVTLSLVLEAAGRGQDRDWAPHLFLATLRAQSEVTVTASFLELSNSPSAFGHLHPKSRTTTRETTARGQGGGAPQPLHRGSPPNQTSMENQPTENGAVTGVLNPIK